MYKFFPLKLGIMQMPALIYSQSEVDLEVLVLARKEKKK